MLAAVVVRPCGTRFTPAEETFHICHTRLSGESVVGYHHERKLSGPTWPYVARRGLAWPCVALLWGRGGVVVLSVECEELVLERGRKDLGLSGRERRGSCGSKGGGTSAGS